MITLTFEPTCPEQAALLGKFLPEYMRAGELRIEGEPEQVKAVVETAAAAQETAAPKRTRAAKPAAATATEAAGSTATETSVPATAATSETKSQPAPTPTETTAGTDVTLEQVRAKLASLSQAGKAADVKGLIAEFGAAKLTDIPADKYGELMQKAEALA